jgi:hypothetical protein
MLCKLAHLLCALLCFVGLGILFWLALNGIFHIAHERMVSSGDRHQVWEMQLQDKHLEKIICLKLAVHLVVMYLWRCMLMKLSHSGLWESTLEVFTKQQWSSEAFLLEGSFKRYHQDQAGCARKVYGLARFSFLPVSRCLLGDRVIG